MMRKIKLHLHSKDCTVDTYRNHIICQNVNTKEVSTIYKESLIRDDLTIERVDITQLVDRQDELKGGALPVGSVEFVQEAMKVANIPRPIPLSYPPQLQKYLKRRIDLVNAKDSKIYLTFRKYLKDNYNKRGYIVPKLFVKPFETKEFDAFTFGGYNQDYDMVNYITDHIPSFTKKVWVSDAVNFVYEYRFYIMDKQIIGYSRYDDHEDEEIEQEPEVIETVKNAIEDFGFIFPYCIDMGILDNGEVALVECNDAWAIGLYGRALTSDVYYNFLRTRWSSIILG